MFPDPIQIALLVLAVIGTGLFCVALGIYNRLALLIDAITDLRALAVGSRDEMQQAKEGIGKVHGDLGQLVANSKVTSELIRSASRLPIR